MDNINQKNREQFMDLSIVLTAFSAFRLEATGMTETYYKTLESIVGKTIVTKLLETFSELHTKANNNTEILESEIRSKILSDTELGPITRNIIKMWFIGTWYKLPNTWQEHFGTLDKNETFVISSNAYTEGLLWPSIDSHPPGAKAPGYGTWADPPYIKIL